MPKRTNRIRNVQNIDALAPLFDAFDFQVESDDFVLYESGRLIEEDRASFEDEEFRRIIDLGIHSHIEVRPQVRARIASTLRKSGDRSAIQTVQALENLDSPLHNLSLIVRTYTAYLFRRLEEVADEPATFENEVHLVIERWHQNQISPESISGALVQIGRPAVGPLAELIFERPEDSGSANLALDILASIRCSSSARVLAHSVLEPILPEDLELKAYKYARALWPMQRDYIIYTLSDHAHEDLPFRWFQLLVECDELNAVDMILEEFVYHGGDPDYAEDLKVVVELLRLSRDPEVEQKLLAVINSADTSPQAIGYLQDFISNFRPSPQPRDNPWSRAERRAILNERYRDAARLFDSGKSSEALHALNAILAEEPTYPFAVALKEIIALPP